MYLQRVILLFILGFFNDVTHSLSISCTLPRIAHGRVRFKQRARIVKFECSARYQLVGNMYASCRDGDWDAPFPVCIKSGCKIPDVKNAVTLSQYNDAWVIFFCLPGHQISGSQVIYCDGAKWNSTAPTCTDTSGGPKLSCDFEDPNLCGWRQDELHDFDWRRLNRHTPSRFLFTGPSFDHTLGKGNDGYYMYIESTSRLENDSARFISPVYDASYAKDGCFSLFYHMFGKTCGGLRVYQKPEKVDIFTVLQPENRNTYIIFEKWGNLGDFWYQSVSNLTDFNDSFQIIIEGIRGSSYTSDIAIDDVAILQGENCSAAVQSAVTPAPPTTEMPSETCLNRCVYSINDMSSSTQCGCSPACFNDHSCCPDFIEVCIFGLDTTSRDETTPSNYSDAIVPQTQKLVRTTQTTSSTTTSSTTTTTTTPKPTTKTTVKPTTKTIRTTKATTKRPTTKRITTKLTTRAPIIKTTKPTTIKATTKPTTKIYTTQAHGVSRTIENHDQYHDLVEKAKKEQRLEKKTLIKGEPERDSNPSKAWKVVLIMGAISICACAVWAGVTLRSARGRIALARFRGRVQSDQEVRYLSTDVDDE